MGPAGYLALAARATVALIFFGTLRSASSTTDPVPSRQASPRAASSVLKLPPLTIVRSHPVWKPRSVSILFSPLPGVKPTRQKPGALFAQQLPRAVWTRNPQRRHRRSTTVQYNHSATSRTSRQLGGFPHIREGDPPRVGEDRPPLPPQSSASVTPAAAPPPLSLQIQHSIKGPRPHHILRRDLSNIGDRTTSAGSPGKSQGAGVRAPLQTRGAGATRLSESRASPGRGRKQNSDARRHPENRHISRVRGPERKRQQDEDGRTRPQWRHGGTRATLRPQATRASSQRQRQNALPAVRQRTNLGHGLGHRRQGGNLVRFWQSQWRLDPTSHRHDTHSPTVGFRGPTGELRGPTTTKRGSTTRGQAEVAQDRTTETLRGPTGAVRRPADKPRRQTEALHGSTETLRGPSEALGRPTGVLGRPKEALRGPTEALRGPKEVLQGPTEVLRGPTEVLGRPTEVLGRPTEVLGRPTEVLGRPTEVLGRPKEALRGPTRALRGQTEAVRGPTEVLRGPTEVLRGPTEVHQGPTEALRGPTEVLGRPKEVLRGQTKARLVPTEVLRGPTPAALRLHQILHRGSSIWAPQSGARIASRPFRPSLLSPENRRERFPASIAQDLPTLGASRAWPPPNPRPALSPAIQQWRDVSFKARQNTKRQPTPKRASWQKGRLAAPPASVRVHTPPASAPPHLSSSSKTQVHVSSTPKPARSSPSPRNLHNLSISGKEDDLRKPSAVRNLLSRNHSASKESSSSFPLSLVRKNVIKTEGKGDAKFKNKVSGVRAAKEKLPNDQAASHSLFYSDFSDKNNLNTPFARDRVTKQNRATKNSLKLRNYAHPKLRNVRAKDEIDINLQKDNRKVLKTLPSTHLQRQPSYLMMGENSKFRLVTPNGLPHEFSKLHYSGLVATSNGLPLGYLYLNPRKPHHQVVFPLCEDCDPYPRSRGTDTKANIVRKMTSEQLDSICLLCTRQQRHEDGRSERRFVEKPPPWCAMCQNSKTSLGLGLSRYNQAAQASLFDTTVAGGSNGRSERERIPPGLVVPVPIKTEKKHSAATFPRDGLSRDNASATEAPPNTLTSKQQTTSEPTTPDIETKKPSATNDSFGPFSLKIPSFLLSPSHQTPDTLAVNEWRPIRQKDGYLPTQAPYAQLYGEKIVPQARKDIIEIGRKIFRPSSLNYGGFIPIPTSTKPPRGILQQKKSDLSEKWKVATSEASNTDETHNAKTRAVTNDQNRHRIKRSALTTQNSESSVVAESTSVSHHRTKRGRLPVAGSPAHVKLEPMMPPVVFFTQDEQYRVLADVHKTMKRSLDMERLSNSVAETVSEPTPKPPLLDTRVTRTLKTVKDVANKSRDAVSRSRATGLLIPKSGGPVIEMNTNTKLKPSSIKQVFRYDIPSGKASSTSESSGRSFYRQPTRSASASLRSILQARPTADGKLRNSPSLPEAGRKSKPAKRQTGSILSLLPGITGANTGAAGQGLSPLQQDVLDDTGGLTTPPPPPTPAPTGPAATTPENEESLLFPGHPPPDIFSPGLVNRAPYRDLLRPPLRTPPARPIVYGKQKYPPHGYGYGRKGSGFGGIGGLIRRVVHFYHRLIFGDAEERPEHLARRPYNPFLHQGLF